MEPVIAPRCCQSSDVVSTQVVDKAVRFIFISELRTLSHRAGL